MGNAFVHQERRKERAGGLCPQPPTFPASFVLCTKHEPTHITAPSPAYVPCSAPLNPPRIKGNRGTQHCTVSSLLCWSLSPCSLPCANSVCPLLNGHLVCNYSRWVLFWLSPAEQGQVERQGPKQCRGARWCHADPRASRSQLQTPLHSQRGETRCCRHRGSRG